MLNFIAMIYIVTKKIIKLKILWSFLSLFFNITCFLIFVQLINDKDKVFY